MAPTTETKDIKKDEVKPAVEAEQKSQVNAVEYQEVTPTQESGVPGSIDILLDMTVPVTVSIGHTQIPIRRLLQLGPGSVIELDTSIEEPAELYLKNNKFATGEVVVVGDRFAIKIKQILGVPGVNKNAK
jgi:flagellar motor switch protein FliN/FliY